MFPFMPETHLWLDQARRTEDRQQADRHRLAAGAPNHRPPAGARTPEDPRTPAGARTLAAVDVADASAAMAGDLRQFLRGLSATTTYRRFLTPALSPSSSELQRLLRADDESRALVALRNGVIVGHAMAVSVAAHDIDDVVGGFDRRVVDIGVVVADRWQHRGIGRQLSCGLLGTCPAAGANELHFMVAASNDPVRRMIRNYWPGAMATFDGTIIYYQARVSEPASTSASAVPALVPGAMGSPRVLCGAGTRR